MSWTLAHLADRVRAQLATGNDPASREQVARLLADALADAAFVEAQFARPVGERTVLYEDPQLGFCLVAHEYPGAKHGGPHDHGPSWAIYGQAGGETSMSDFEVVAPATPDGPGRVRKLRTYAMRPGDVHVYNEGDVHAPSRTDTTRLLRVEGVNLAQLPRARYQEVAA